MSKKLVHRRAGLDVMQRLDGNGKRVPFSLRFVKKDTGEIINIQEAILLSYYMKKRTITIKILGSEQIRGIRTSLIIEFNGFEWYV